MDDEIIHVLMLKESAIQKPYPTALLETLIYPFKNLAYHEVPSTPLTTLGLDYDIFSNAMTLIAFSYLPDFKS